MQKSEIVGDSVPAGALITTFQKGLQYLELEANLAAEVPRKSPTLHSTDTDRKQMGLHSRPRCSLSLQVRDVSSWFTNGRRPGVSQGTLLML